MDATQHDETEYGEKKDPATGAFYGGPFWIEVPPEMRVEHVRLAIYVSFSRSTELYQILPAFFSPPFRCPTGEVRHHPRAAEAYVRREKNE